MKRRVELLDTSIVVEILAIPGKSTRHDEISAEFDMRQQAGVELHLPVAAIIEAGNHVDRIANGHDRRRAAQGFSTLITATCNGTAPWSFNPLTWDPPLLQSLIAPKYTSLLPLAESLASKHLQMGDLLLVAQFLRMRGNLDRRVVDLDVWTLEATLRGVIDHLRST